MHFCCVTISKKVILLFLTLSNVMPMNTIKLSCTKAENNFTLCTQKYSKNNVGVSGFIEN